MMGLKARVFKTHTHVNLEQLIPQNNFYRQLETKLDLSFVRTLVADTYASFGRPSIDPIVFFKLQLLMFFEGIRSERLLLKQAHLQLAWRWYLGYDLDEVLPDHSSLTKIRMRYGLAIFQRFFERVVGLCTQAGLVWGQELHFDSTVSEANADYDKSVPRFYWNAQQHLGALFEGEGTTDGQPPAEIVTPTDAQTDAYFVGKYSGHERMVAESSYQRQVDYMVNPTDPNASPMGQGKLGYRTHYVVDGGKARIILGCLVTPTTIQDNTPMLDLAWRLRFRWQLPLDRVVGDSKFGTIPNIVGLEDNGVKAFTPAHASKAGRSKGVFPKSAFVYDAKNDCYLCPQGETLPRRRADDKAQAFVYYATRKVCGACPLKSQCTSNRWRQISRSYHQEYLDRVAAYQKTPAYQKAMRKRQVWIEPKFAESKLWHHGRRFRWRGIQKVNIEALLRATGQNLKQWLKKRTKFAPLPPSKAQALAVARHFS
jgi:transposase